MTILKNEMRDFPFVEYLSYVIVEKLDRESAYQEFTEAVQDFMKDEVIEIEFVSIVDERRADTKGKSLVEISAILRIRERVSPSQ